MSAAWGGGPDDRRDSSVAAWIKATLFFLLLFGAVCVSMQGAAIRPDLIHGGNSQPYRFDRIGADEVAWFAQSYGPNEIPSAPIRLYRGAEPEHRNGRECHTETPEASTLALCIAGLACIRMLR